MTESIIRIEQRRDFTVLQNEILRDRRLCLKTKGLFAVMLSRPGNWQFSVSGLSAYTGAGRDAIRSALKELREAGYLTMEKQSHGERGKFAGSVYILHEESVQPEKAAPWPDYPSTADPTTGEPTSENPPQINTDLNKDCLNKTPKAPQGGQAASRRRRDKSVPVWKPERFEAFWALYPRREDRVGAVREWARLKPDGALLAAMGRALRAQMAGELWRRGIGIPYACRWLKNHRWEDAPPEPAGGPPSGGGRVLENEKVQSW